MKLYFLGKKKLIWLVLSSILIVGSIISLFIWRLPLGIDFQGGIQAELQFSKNINESEIVAVAKDVESIKNLKIASTGDKTFQLRALPVSHEIYGEFKQKIAESVGEFEELRFQSVGPTVSRDLTRKALIAIILSTVLIILYLAYAFRSVKSPMSPWQFGVSAALALIHDTIITIGIFSLLAAIFRFEVDSSFLVALLTIIGFSVHDTIVTFDRIRENTTGSNLPAQANFELIVDQSLVQTLNRSLATSLTFIFAAGALALLGGETIRPFVITLIIGVTIGTYSSICFAPVILVNWMNKRKGLPQV